MCAWVCGENMCEYVCVVRIKRVEMIGSVLVALVNMFVSSVYHFGRRLICCVLFKLWVVWSKILGFKLF